MRKKVARTPTGQEPIVRGMKAMARTVRHKIHTPRSFEPIAKALKKKGKRLVQCDGVFDLLHPGHIEYFHFAKEHGDILYVVIVADAFVQKGPGRPIFNETIRSRWIASLACVDYVIINKDIGPQSVIEKIQPDILAKGRGYKKTPTEGFLRNRASVESYGGKVLFAPELMHATPLLERLEKFLN